MPPVHRLRQPVDAAAVAQAIDRRYRARWRRGRLPGLSEQLDEGVFVRPRADRDRQDDFANIGIDPRLFRAFDVQAVPTYVAVSSDFDLCAGFSARPRFRPMTVSLATSRLNMRSSSLPREWTGRPRRRRWALQHAQGQSVRSIPASAALVVALTVVTPALAQTTVEEAREQGKALGTQKRNDPTLVPSSDAQAAAVPGYSGPSLPEGSYFDDPERLEAAGQSAKSSNEQYRITTDADRTRDVQQFGDLGDHAEGDVGRERSIHLSGR
jgi:hypothetical protein